MASVPAPASEPLMEREANYAAVGAFVLIVTLLGALFVYWYSDAREHRSYNRYEIYFTGSVSGLDRGAAVRYLGVGVGRVVDMHVDPRDPRVVYAAKTPPRTALKRWAARLGKRIVYLPLGALAPATARRLHTFHVLAHRGVRAYAKDFIG